MMLFRLRWRDDASGFVAAFAGQPAHPDAFGRDEAERLVRAAPNGDQVDLVPVDGGVA
jgi:hypothetical protein